MMGLPKKIFLSLIAVACATATWAQDAADEAPQLKAEFSVFPLEPANWKGILFAPTGDPTRSTRELRFNPHERTLGYKYNGPAPLRFYREIITKEGDKTYQTVAEVNPGVGSFLDPLILFFHPEEKEGPYVVDYMFDSPRNFPEDTLVFFNTMSVTFEGILGDERISLKPGASSPIDVSNYFDAPAPIGLVIQQGNDLHKVLMNKMRFSPERRTLLILRKPKSETSLRIRTQRLTEYTGRRNSEDDPGV